MGIGLPGQQRLGAGDHLLADVGVKIERPDGGNLRSHDVTHRLHQISFQVADLFDRGAAVQGEQHSVHRQGLTQPSQKLRLQ